MKKLFIQCVVLVMCISIFVPGIVSAQTVVKTEKINCDPYYLLEWVSRQVPCTKTTYSDGKYKISRDDRGVVDYYDASGKKLDTAFNIIDDIAGLGNGLEQMENPIDNLANNIVKQQLDPVVEGFQQTVKEVILNILWTISKFIAWVTGLVGWIFDNIIKTLTPNSKEEWEIKIDGSILSAWKIIRDVASIIIIFSLLYLGIKTILDGQGFADKKTLISIIVAAILLNFSLLFTKEIAFHISNRIGNEILQTAIPQNQQSGKNSFSASMLGMIGPQRLFSENGGLENFNAESLSGDSWTQIGMFAMQTVILSFVLLVAVFIFIALIIMLIIRFIVFVILMITAPLGIIAFTIPWLKHHGQTWWAELKKQTIFFPAFVFVMYIIFLIIGTIGGSEPVRSLAVDTGSLGEDTLKTAGAFFLNFALIIGFLIVLLIAPSKISEGGSSLVTNATNWSNKKIRSYAGRAAGAASFGTASMIGRNTVGRGAAKLLENKGLQSAAQNAKGFKGTAARALLKRADKAQDYSFDARATTAGAKLGMGAASKGWKSTIEDKKQAYKKQMEKEKKLYGFGEMTEEQKTQHTQDLTVAKDTRDQHEKGVKEFEKKLVEAKNNGSSEAVINQIAKDLRDKQAALKKSETEVGKLMQAGDSSYIKYLKDQRHRGLNVYKRMSRTQKLALEALEKDMNKEWQAAGKAKPAKKNKPATPPPPPTPPLPPTPTP